MRLVLATLCTSLALMSAATPAQARRQCANVPGGDVISASNLTCRSAHKLVRGWLAGVRRDGRYDRTVFGFRCRNRPSSSEGDTMFCTKGSSRATWYVNVPR